MYSTLRTNTRNIYISVSVRVRRRHTGVDALQYRNISENIITPLRDDLMSFFNVNLELASFAKDSVDANLRFCSAFTHK